MSDRQPPTFVRRTVLAGAATGLLGGIAGCLSASPEGSPDLVLINHNENPVTATVSVTNSNGETLTSTELEVPVVERNTEPNASIDDVFESDGQYTVSVDVTDGPSATEELDVTGTDDDSDSHSIELDGGEITFS
ncbi:hypothetical protein [Halobacterium jilantaiense]|uniref:Uncharacterized protein n=1 Tax=Halobacterium jilantaiense TaxID=355548 RepID=A0A1I0MWF7_9EURY|nr:hypothetical protein [Halobacterium jilantaiense]SEV93127.1 hypothetical protein SAMN04487945_0430 [Halobacterium jilantaiense]